jgi:hypothetical protein
MELHSEPDFITFSSFFSSFRIVASVANEGMKTPLLCQWMAGRDSVDDKKHEKSLLKRKNPQIH